MDSPSSSRASSPQHSIINSPSLRKHRDRAATASYRPVHQPSFAPSTTPLKSPGVRYRQQQQQQLQEKERQEEESDFHDILQSKVPQVLHSTQAHEQTTSLFKVPSYLSRRTTESESRPASAIHLQQASEMSKSLYKLLEDNAHTKEGVSRQAQDSVSVANQSLEVFRQSQRKSSGTTPSSASRTATAAAEGQQPVSKPLLRTTETEYDISPSRTARRMTSPPASSFVGTPSRRSHLRNQIPGTMHPASPTRQQSQDQPVEAQSRHEDRATLEWLKQTVDAAEFDHQRYTRQASTEVGTLPEQQEEHEGHEDPYQANDQHHQETDLFDLTTRREDSYSHKRQSLGSPSRRRRSNEQAEDTYSQKENIPIEAETTTLLDSYLSRSTLYPKTPEVDHSVIEAENSLVEVAETTTSITNQLRGVYTNLQDFFSPETEAKLDVITVIGSQKAIRVAKGLSSSTTRPRPLEFRSASVRKDYRKPSSAPQSTRLLTTPQPFNFSERLTQIQTRRPNSSLSKSIGVSPVVRSSRAQDLHRAKNNAPSTPIAQNRTANEYQEMSKSPFIPLAQRKRLLEKSSLNTHTESTNRALTNPKAPVLHTSARAKTTATPHEERVLQDIIHEGGYKANTLDKHTFEGTGVSGLPKVVKPRLTIPKSPVLTKRRPAPMRPAVMPNSHHQQKKQQHQTHKAGITERGLVSSAESARRLSQDKNRKPAAHHPPAGKPQLTVPEPFSLATEARGERYQEQFRNKLTKWRQIEKEHQFKALPLPSYPEVFVPKKSTRPLTHVEDVHLQTDRRAEEREAFEQERLRKEKIAQDIMAAKAREDELRELRELRALRERLVPHPTPIRNYPRIEIHKSTRPLTTPRSPNIGQKRKRQMTLDREESNDYEEQLRRPARNHHHHQEQQNHQSRRDSRHDQHQHQHQHQHVDPEDEHMHEQEEEHHYIEAADPQEQVERERERRRESERAQEQEYERRRLSSFSNSRGEGGNGPADRERQNRIREEIEQQRERDQDYLLEREERLLQAERQAYRRQSSSQKQQGRVSSSAGVGGRRDEYVDREEYGQDKRQRIREEVPAAKYESQLFARKMGRKSWIAANDI
ncbi:Protein tpx2 [Mortierella sp. 14UC]|nr:Protein tpx2 [Mortierella sp. 14UC]